MTDIKLFWLLILCTLSACSSTPSPQITNISSSLATNGKVLKSAYSWLGTPYSYGGMNKQGTDCSGLVYKVFLQNQIVLPRTSYKQANSGKNIDRNHAKPGDLIFFRTSGRNISHVGIISEINGNELRFIHSSESKGVIISSSENVYWKPRFVKVVRVIQ